MKLDSHVVKNLFKDPTGFTAEIIEAMHDSNGAQLADAAGKIDEGRYDDIIATCSPKGNKTYYITKSVTEHLELFDTKKAMNVEGWKIFKSLPDFKKTYILPDMPVSYAKYGGSGFLRVLKNNGFLVFLHITCKFLPPAERTRTTDSSMYIVMLYIDLEKNEMCHHFQSEDGKSLTPFLYSLLCFIEFCDNEVVEVKPKAKYGTQKSGKIINIFDFPIIVVNNTWNIKTVRSDAFPVRGHVALRHTKLGPRMVYIEPYQKEGYTRRSGKEIANSKQQP